MRFPPLFLFAASAVVNTVVHAGPAYHFAPVTQQIDDLLSSHPGISGASLIVIREGAPIYEEYFGDYTQTTRIPIASASKWLSAIAIERLVERGQMRWSDTVGEYFPGASADKQAITLGQLFSHTSGLPANDAPCVGDPSYSLDSCAQQILGLALAYAPGSAFAYTGNGMQVGGRMAEIATGKSWAQIFADEVTTPLGMPDTSFYHPGANPQIAGGIGATMLDYSHAVQMIAQHGTWNGAQYLEADGIVEMQKDQTHGAPVLNSPDPMAYGYGYGEWRNLVDAQGNAVQVSSTGKYATSPWVDNQTGVAAVFLVYTTAALLHEQLYALWGNVRAVVLDPIYGDGFD
ncbi:serine hydrolase domain-containing protein [Dokdonella sp.]|uniref:serine hydrolase domain-containing protein n=1 Tax=Dokdonella sp. TaxID=2291710 RepID=UPI003783AA83